MDANYSASQTPQFHVLSDRQIERVYQATLECLNRTGVDVHNAEARDLLARASSELNPVETVLSEVSPAIGAHIGPGTVGLAFMAGM